MAGEDDVGPTAPPGGTAYPPPTAYPDGGIAPSPTGAGTAAAPGTGSVPGTDPAAGVVPTTDPTAAPTTDPAATPVTNPPPGTDPGTDPGVVVDPVVDPGTDPVSVPPPWPMLTQCGTQYCGNEDPDIGLGTIRVTQNEWTDPDANTCVFFNCDGSFGWSWDRGGTAGQAPNYPEAEFGINPWNDEEPRTTSTTTQLPLQIKDIHSASMTADLSTTGVWGDHNLAFEMWFSENHPETNPPGNPKAEIMVFFAWHDGYWPTDPCCSWDTKHSGGTNYVLYQSDDNWGSWGIYRQYRREGGSNHNFNGTLDIKPFLEGFNGDWWVTRFEIGNEIYQNSGGTTTIRNLCFEVNGTTECAQNH